MLPLEHGADPDAKQGHGLAPLHMAVMVGDSALVKTFLAQGTEARIEDADGVTPLGYAAAMGFTEVAQYLADGGTQLTFQAAAAVGRIEALQEFLAEDPDADRPGLDEKTALAFAAVNGQLEAAGLLLQHGAEPNSLDAHGIRGQHTDSRSPVLPATGARARPEGSAAAAATTAPPLAAPASLGDHHSMHSVRRQVGSVCLWRPARYAVLTTATPSALRALALTLIPRCQTVEVGELSVTDAPYFP